MTALAPGVRVKCVKIGNWINGLNGSSHSGPSVGSVWTVKQVVEWDGEPYLVLEKWPDDFACFAASRFTLLDGNEDISALIDAFAKGVVDGERVRIVERVR
jgi:hypothetical protein